MFGIAATAGFFDEYDRALLSLALKQIQRGLGIAEANLVALLSSIRIGYVLSLLVTPWADLIGRRRLLLYTIVGYTVFTGLAAILPRLLGRSGFVNTLISSPRVRLSPLAVTLSRRFKARGMPALAPRLLLR